MPQLTIDGKIVEAASGATLLEAAATLGIDIPTLCHCQGVPPRTSCMLCVVKDTRTGRSLPACSALADEGMVVETHSEEIVAARREVLQLLLSEHTGDCEAPCRRTCPASLQIPYMLRLIQQGEVAAAARIAKRDLIIPATLGYVCSAPCEKGCRRHAIDEAVAIQEMHRQVAEACMKEAERSSCASESGMHVAVLGSGAAGLAAAWELRRLGHACVVHEEGLCVGGELWDHKELPVWVLEAEIESIRQAGVIFELNSTRTVDDLLGGGYDAVIIAHGGAQTPQERVFVAKTEHMPVRSVFHGKMAAAEADAFLMGHDNGHAKPFDSRMHRLHREEALLFSENRIAPEALARGRCPEQQQEEAARCLHCDCLRPTSCKLRRYATEYGAKGHVYGDAERLPLDRVRQGAGVLYEPGKCVRCGLCVEITRQEGEPFGLGFTGRGYGIQVAPPLHAGLDAALSKTARRCVEACPTGALAWEGQEENTPP